MQARYHILEGNNWKDYSLIDCGGSEKLERFGTYVLCRPEPQAIWDKKLPEEQWAQQWNARYIRDKGESQDSAQSEKGSWRKKAGMKDKWDIAYKGQGLNIRMNLSLTAFGHIGVFPEQRSNWEFIYSAVSGIRNKLAAEGQMNEKVRILNLFAYTGGATLAAAQAGAEVVHLDSVKQVVNWAGENKASSKTEAVIRWMIDDAMKFVQREIRRGSMYNGIILDPPAYGRGPAGEKWLLDRDLNAMLKACEKLLMKKNSFLLLNIYSVGFSAIILDTLVNSIFKGGASAEMGELCLRSEQGDVLPLGTFLRLMR